MKHFTIILILFAFVSCKKNDTEKTSVKQTENDEIEVYNFEELERFLDQEKDKTLVVNFWATWCKPCIKELPYFEAAQTKYNDDIRVILVSLDFPEKLESQLIPFVNKNAIQSQVVLLDDPYENEWIPKVDSTWSGAIPATLIINSTKRIFYEKSFTQEELEDEILKFKNI
jgi:thiol-disulfide isomerase/thioredoxin